MIPFNPYTLLSFQIVAHLSLIPMIMYAEPIHYLISFFVYFLTGCFGMTMTYHRLLSHRSWKCSKFLEYLFVSIATVGLTGSAISWVAIHRKHHKFSDTDTDPHSPMYKGFLYSHFLSMFSKVNIKYSFDLLKEKFYKYQHNYYLDVNLLFGLFLFLIDPFLIVYVWLFPAMILWNMGSFIVSMSHLNGEPTNNNILGLFVWGEGWHLNHHNNSKCFKFHKYDIGGWLIDKIRIKTSSMD